MKNFYKNKKVLITGNTGFKGAWMCETLLFFGANIVGYALDSPTSPNLFSFLNLQSRMKTIIGDIRDREKLVKVFEEEKPEIVIHMAAQPIVRESYKNPAYTYEVNVMGTVNVLECIRNTPSVKSVINVTTDKVYKNKEWHWGYRENEELDGFDPYSNSKSCSELVTGSYKNSFFSERDIAISTMRAGNVIGGGDFAVDRIVPDCIRAAIENTDIVIRNPYSVRPYQYVLEPVMAYLMVAMKQYTDKTVAGCYNVGPEDVNCVTTGHLADVFCQTWKTATGKEIIWDDQYDGGPHEATFLKLDCAKIKSVFGWKPCWDIEKVIEKSIEVYLSCYNDSDVIDCVKSQIKEYLEDLKNSKIKLDG